MLGQVSGLMYNLTGDTIQVYDSQGAIISISCGDCFRYDDKTYELDGQKYDIGTKDAPIIVVAKEDYDHYRSIGHGLVKNMAYIANNGEAQSGRNGHLVHTVCRENSKGEIIRIYATNNVVNDPIHTTIIDG